MILNIFRRIEIPDVIPKQLDIKIKEFSKSRDKEEFLHKSFLYIVSNWGGSRINTILKFFRGYQTNLNKIIKMKGYMPCVTMNYLLRVMVVKSGFFEDKDIKIKLTNSWFIVPHQYLEIKISNKKIFLLIHIIINLE
ncbi:hypothetical protein KAI32_00690 [Candidatus Pacearchaeota archaeon]|nr:hypothetical protein [Candidatus Pacearchaeota archaeon]